jgi:glutamate-1-semialdehyde 2,1-aminomutase
VPTNSELYDRGRRVIPGGVNSPVRAFRSVGGTPFFVARGDGARIWDVEGREYLDYVQSYGASILGHAPAHLVNAVQDAVTRGSTFGAPTEREVLLAEAIVERVPGLEMVRLVSSGTEATMSAIRVARGATGRERIVKFAGNYHGHSDGLLAAGGSGVADQGLADSAGVTAGAVADTIVAPYNQVPELDESIAAVIVEPVAANMGLVRPRPRFLEGLRDACTRAGAMLIFDEVITGFRVAPGGATEDMGITPDLWCFGKVIGGGLPVGAFGGTGETMALLAPDGPVYQAGTLSGNPLATAAGLAVLDRLDDDAYAQLDELAAALADGLRDAIAGAGLPVVTPRYGPLVGIFFGPEEPTNFDEARAVADNGTYRTFFRAMLDRGIAMAPGPYEIMFPSLAHTPADIAHTVAVATDAATQIAVSGA